MQTVFFSIGMIQVLFESLYSCI